MANGIASDRAGAVNVGPISQIGTESITPGVADLSDAFRQGFITVDDIQRRFRQGQAEQSALKSQIQADEIQRRLAPGAAENALAAQGLQAAQISAAGQVLPGQTENTLATQELQGRQLDTANRLTSPDPATRQAALNEQTEMEYQQIYGEPPPDSLESVAPEPVESFQEWFDANKGDELEADVLAFAQIAGPKPSAREIQAYANQLTQRGVTGQAFEDQVLSFSAGTQKDPQVIKAFADRRLAEMQASQMIREEYKAHAAQKQNAVKSVKRGDPAYNLQIRQMVELGKQNKLLQGAKLAAVGEGYKAQVTEAAKGPQRANEAAAKLRAEVEGSKPIQNFRLQETAANLVNTLATIPNPSNRTDLQLIYAGVKLADPGSVVREGEIALSRQADPVLVAMKKRLEGITSRSGKLLDATDRAELVRIARTVIDQARSQVQPEFQKFQRLAEQQGIPFQDIVNTTEAGIAGGTPAAQQTAAPPPANVGARRVVQDGVTFEWNGTAYVPVQ